LKLSIAIDELRAQLRARRDCGDRQQVVSKSQIVIVGVPELQMPRFWTRPLAEDVRSMVIGFIDGCGFQ
jgi:hypothetical protein